MHNVAQVAPEAGALKAGEEVVIEVRFCPQETIDCDRCLPACSSFLPDCQMCICAFFQNEQLMHSSMPLNSDRQLTLVPLLPNHI